jgi:23S rRNA (uracil-5-)-methyltransferase RumA
MGKQSDHTGTEAELIELRIESTAFGGKGVARKDGKVYFVEGAVSGDVAECEIVEASDRYSEARVVKLLEPSSHRGPSPCPVSDVCGGCQWQGVPYATQLEWKKGFVLNALKRIGKIDNPVNVEMLASPRINGYRNRIFMRARLQPDGLLYLGYFRRSSQDFVPIETCPIAVSRINEFIRNARAVSFASECQKANITSEVKFRLEVQDLPSESGEHPHLLVTIYDPDDKSFPISSIIEKISSLPSVKWCGNSRDLHTAPRVLFESHLNREFHTAPGIFQQINIDHNHTVRSLVIEAVKKFQPSRILDVFCGSGNLSLALADGQTVIDGVEFSKRAIDVANYNVAAQGLKNANYYSGDTEKFLWRAAKQGVKYDLVIADPPREGMFKALIPLMKIRPQQIIYISCDPSTLSRDLGSLCRTQYKITKFSALDFFPNTYHIESFVILEAK